MSHVCTRQLQCEPWMWEHLVQEHAIALGQAINVSTCKNYGSALNSYLLFVCMYDMPVEPTPDTLSLYTVFTCHHIKPDSIDTYLSSICHQLELYFPNIWEILKSRLVHCTLEGCKCLRGSPTICKRALTIADLNTVCIAHSFQPSHDDHLFCTQLCISFFVLMCLLPGRMTLSFVTHKR